MTERWIQAVVVGPGRPGHLKVAVGSGITKRVTDAPADMIPPDLRLPNSIFLAIMRRGALVRVEHFDQQLIDLQERIRTILNTLWDPIGVGHVVDDEYDSYISDILELLEGGAGAEGLADYLRLIEVERMSLTESPRHKLLAVAEALRAVSPVANRESED